MIISTKRKQKEFFEKTLILKSVISNNESPLARL